MSSSTAPFFITTPIYYVNDSPHIGHAYTTIACDVMARYQRLTGREVFFLTGTDEHGQKVAKSAAAKQIDPQAFTDDVSGRFRRLVKDPLQQGGGENLLGVSNDDFIRTTEARHKAACQALWTRIAERKTPKGNPCIYKDTYGGWYAVRDEAYYAEGELIERDGKKLAPSGAEVEWVEEESYFFRLSDYAESLLNLYAAGTFVQPESKLNEVRRFVEGGLKDLSISRTTFNWGVPVPGDDAHIMYVWIDALTNYITALGYPNDGATFDRFWREPADAPVHVVGKDILRFHAVYWPAFLMAAELPVPKKIVAHGWWTIEGEKMSKSLGNVLSPDEMIAKAGGVDALRYFLLRAMPFGNDGDFSRERMVEVINADLANNIGNLAQRTLSMIQKNAGGKVPDYDRDNAVEADRLLLADTVARATDEYRKQMADFGFHLALQAVVDLASAANLYIDQQQPWVLKKTDSKRMGEVLYVLAETTRILAILLKPFCPAAADRLLDQLAVNSSQREWHHASADFALRAGILLPVPVGIFPRLVEEAAA